LDHALKGAVALLSGGSPSLAWRVTDDLDGRTIAQTMRNSDLQQQRQVQ
jgi:hypothetical protein